MVWEICFCYTLGTRLLQWRSIARPCSRWSYYWMNEARLVIHLRIWISWYDNWQVSLISNSKLLVKECRYQLETISWPFWNTLIFGYILSASCSTLEYRVFPCKHINYNIKYRHLVHITLEGWFNILFRTYEYVNSKSDSRSKSWTLASTD